MPNYDGRGLAIGGGEPILILRFLWSEDSNFAGDWVDLDCGEVGGFYAVGLGVVFVVDGEEPVGIWDAG